LPNARSRCAASALFLLPLLIALIIALAVWCIFLIVPGNIYEYLTLSEIRKTTAEGAGELEQRTSEKTKKARAYAPASLKMN
jgi:hypothetical protein